ncbi:winged helix DNA-binding protein [Frondihabitans australicus]|uniref:Winged helix DNA-binding protein n=1 Tax=Frondihabitans australicus TaxID=386892 RepID=A0A495ID39_9MICO|nr:winged helix DNA-binding protein [Frondihabitans australicus]
MGIRDVARRRLVAQGIARDPSDADDPAPTLAEVAASQLATQAQDLPGAKWALGLRARATEVEVDAALADGTVVRTWPARGTLMITARADVRWLTELLAPRAFGAAASVWRRDGLTPDDFVRASDIARAELRGRSLARDALLEVWRANGIETTKNRGSHLLRQLAGEALIVFGPPTTNPKTGAAVQTFALLADHAPEAEPRDRDDALRELAVRYFTGHGPATVRDLAWWSGLTIADCRRAVDLAGDALARCDVTGQEPGPQDREALLTSAAHPPSIAEPGDVRILPPFDELLVGYADRAAHLDEGDFAKVVPASNGLFRPVVTVDGRVVGTWRRTLVKNDAVDVAVETFRPLDAAVEAAIDARVDEYARFAARSRYEAASG